MDAQPPSKIPSALLAVYDELRTEATWMHGRWLTYRELFAESQRRIDLLNESAGTFFYIVEDVLLDEVQLSLSKLTDPAKTGAHENLSLEQLHSILEAHGDPVLVSKCRGILDTLHEQCKLFRIRRHKRLAHLDLNFALRIHTDPIGISRQMIENALLLVREYLNSIEMHYNDSEWGYEHFILNDGANALLATLRSGLRYEELVQGRMLPWDDWRKGKWSDA